MRYPYSEIDELTKSGGVDDDGECERFNFESDFELSVGCVRIRIGKYNPIKTV